MICIYEANTTSWHGNGLCILQPSSCTVSEIAGGDAKCNAVILKNVLSGSERGAARAIVTLNAGAALLVAGMAESIADGVRLAERSIDSGAALKKLSELVEAQDGSAQDVFDTSRLPLAKVQMEVPSDCAGFLSHMECEKIGLISMHLGGGRAKKEDTIDLSVGLVLHKKVGDRVEKGESLATIHASTEEKAQEAAALLRACCTFSDSPVERPAFIKAIIR